MAEKEWDGIERRDVWKDCIHCESVRERTAKIDSIIEKLDSKISTKTMVAVVTIVLAVIGIFTGVLHQGYRDTVREQKETDASIAVSLSMQSEKTNHTLTSITASLVGIQADIKNMKDRK